MSSRDLFRAIGQIDDDLIESANKTPVKHTIPLHSGILFRQQLVFVLFC